jgi:hypothetical protein
MALNNIRSGLGYVPAYQVSSIPFLTSSLTVPDRNSTPLEINFQLVTKFVVVTNTYGGAQNIPLRVGFSENGVKGTENNNYLILNNGESFEADFRVTKMFLLSDSTTFATSGSVVAGLTDIGANMLIYNWSGSIGVG